MDKTTALNHAKHYARLVCEEMFPCKVVLFGSLASDNFDENSDIDIAVIKDGFNENYWELTKKLNRLTRGIDSRIEPILLQSDSDQSGFLTAILSKGIELK